MATENWTGTYESLPIGASESCTQRIDAMKLVEDQLAAGLRGLCDEDLAPVPCGQAVPGRSAGGPGQLGKLVRVVAAPAGRCELAERPRRLASTHPARV